MKSLFALFVVVGLTGIMGCSPDVEGPSEQGSSDLGNSSVESVDDQSSDAVGAESSAPDDASSDELSFSSLEERSSSVMQSSDDLSTGASSDESSSVMVSSSEEVESSSSAVSKNELDPTIEQKVDSILKMMTLEEKVGQMIQPSMVEVLYGWNEINNLADYNIGSVIWGSNDNVPNNAASWMDEADKVQDVMMNSRLKIPMLIGIDAVHGNNYLAGSVVFPHNINLAASGDATLAEEIGRITALETAAGGSNWTFGPCVTVSRNERWGRVYEGLGETAEIATPLSRALVTGLQGDLLDTKTIGATAKHFLGDGATLNGIERGEAVISDKDLRDIYLPPYEAAIDAGVTAVMAAFNSVNGIRMHMHKEILTGILKEELGFNGVVVSDWEGFWVEGGTVKGALEAGVDIFMAVGKEGKKYTNVHGEIVQLVQSGQVDEGIVTESCRRILRMKFRLGLFENPYGDRSLTQQVGLEEHKAVAREAVQKSMVVAKNSNSFLPLKKSGKIAVAGWHANNLSLQSGGWTRDWQGYKKDGNWADYDGGAATTILEGVEEVAGSAEVVYNTTEVVSGADVAIIVVGEEPYAEWLGDDYACKSSGGMPSSAMDCAREGRNALYIPHDQSAIIRAYTEANIPFVVVLISGRPMLLGDEINASDAFVMAFLPGSEGAGVADVLFGDVTPTGTLPYTWPKTYEQIPINIGDDHYGDAEFPLGHGLTW
ncbi:MAG: glycoside hydrolase family 3 C-terminal domain-containing protein [Fibrobacterales bacterium]